MHRAVALLSALALPAATVAAQALAGGALHGTVRDDQGALIGHVQGLNSRVLLTVDGVPMNQGDRGGIDWDLLAVDEVESVDILKGAGSSLYGSAALGGVVNVTTRDVPSGLHSRVRLTGGVYADPPYAIWQFRDNR